MLATILSAISAFSRGQRPEPHLGAYTLGRKLGEGGMGVVYEARHRHLRRRAAVKVLPAGRAGDAGLRRFEREVQVMAQLSHPNIVPVYDYGRERDGTVYYAMEYLDGIDLERLVARDGAQPPARVVHILRQAAEALAEAHALGVIHRDIKPANLVLTQQPRRPDLVKILDFGLVKEVAPSEPGVTCDGAVAGTPLYLAPEAVTAPGELDGRADVYALGAVGYFLLTGRPPFTGKSAVDVMAQHLYATPVPPGAHAPVPAALEALILACLAKRPEDRPASAAELAAALRALG